MSKRTYLNRHQNIHSHQLANNNKNNLLATIANRQKEKKTLNN